MPIAGQDGVRPGLWRGLSGDSVGAARRVGGGQRHLELHGAGSRAPGRRNGHRHRHLRSLGPRVGVLLWSSSSSF